MARVVSRWLGTTVTGYRGYVLMVVSAIALLNGADSSILAGVASAVQKDFRLSDVEVGSLGSAYIVVYALAVVPFGLLADGGLRRRVIAIGVAIWSLATFATGLAGGYAAMLAARAVVGIGEASYLPASNSLIGDYYPREQRGTALSWVNGGFRVGIALGILAGGAIAVHLGWRTAFFIAGVPGLVLAYLALRLREPERGASEGLPPVLKITGDYDLRTYGRLVRIPTLVSIVFVVTFGLFVSAGIGYWLPIYLQRRYGLDLGRASALTGAPLLVGGLIGNFGGGWLADRRGRRTAGGPLEVTGWAFLGGAVLLVLTFLAPAAPAFAVLYLLATVCLAVYIPAVQSMAQNVVVPIRRASAVTLALLVGNLLGNALAPVTIGLASDMTHDLGRALLISGGALSLLAGATSLVGSRFAAGDSVRMDAEWRRLVEAAFVPAAQPAVAPGAAGR